MKIDSKYLGALYLAIASSIWGGLFVVVRLVVPVIPPVPLVWLRYLVAVVVLLAVILVTRTSLRVKRKDWRLFFIVSLIGYTLSIVTQEYGTSLSSAQAGSVVTSATPAFMVIFGWLILKEKLTLRKIASIIMATAGVWLIVGVDDFGADFRFGGLCLVVAAVTWAYMSIILKKIPAEYPPLIVNFYAVLISLVCLLPVNITNLQQLPWTTIFAEPVLWGGVVYLGAISTSFAFILWNKGVVMVDTAVSGLFFFFQPLVGSLLGCIILGEPLTINFWFGSMLIFVGVFMVIGQKNQGTEATMTESTKKVSVQ